MSTRSRRPRPGVKEDPFVGRRLNVPLSSACTLALFREDDGELAIRLLQRRHFGGPGVFLTPKILVDPDDLMRTTQPHDQTLRADRLTIELGGTKAWVRLHNVLAGWTGREAYGYWVGGFLKRHYFGIEAVRFTGPEEVTSTLSSMRTPP